MSFESINDERPTNNQESEGTRRRRRGQYNYADHGATGLDRFRIGDNVNWNGRRDSAKSSRRKHKRTKAESNELNAKLNRRNNGQPWFICYSICTQMAGGGNAALVLSRLAYWLSERESGAGPRANPLPDVDDTAWAPSYSGLAEQIGLGTSNPGATRMKVQRAVDRLVARNLVEICPGIPRADLPDEVQGQTLAPSDCRESLRNRIWLNEECVERLRKAGLLQCTDKSPKCIKVWLEHVQQHGANKAIVLGALHYQFFQLKEKRLGITHKDEKWWVCSAAQMSRDTGLSKGQARRAIEALVEEELVLRDIERFTSSPTSHLRPNFPSLLKDHKKKRKRRAKK